MQEENIIREYLEEGAKARMDIDVDKIMKISDVLVSAFSKGNKLLFMGNGGSAADAQHIAAEFVGRFEIERKALPALALHCNSSSVTAISNDYSYDRVFERQIAAFAHEGDVVFALSTSGNSGNVLEGIKEAIRRNCIVVGITGKNGGKMAEMIESQYLFKINSNKTSIIQETTITIGHLISKITEKKMFGEG